MSLRPGLVLFLALIGCAPSIVPAAAQTVIPLPVGTGLANPHSLAVDAGGNIFVADFGNDTVQEIPAAGGYMSVTRLASAYGDFNAPGGIAIDGSGNLFVADTGNNAVKEILAAGGYVTVVTLAAISGEFKAPSAIAIDAAGNVFVADTGNNAVKEIVAASGYVTVETLAAATGGFVQPTTIGIDSHDNVFVGDSSGTSLKEILAAGGYVTVNPITSSATAGIPVALALDTADNLYAVYNVPIADMIQGGIVEEYTAASAYATTNAVVPLIPFPDIKSGIALDRSGNIFTTDLGSTQVQEYPVAQSYAPTPIPAATSFWDYPGGVAVDRSGNVFVVDNGSTQTIKEIAAAGGYATVTTLPGSIGTLTGPESIAVDGGGNLFIVDTGEVKEMPASGGYATVITLPASSNFTDTLGIAVDADSNVFVTQSYQNLVLEIPAAGGYTNVQTLAAANGHFNFPAALAVDGNGNVFVTDNGNGVVKEILAAGGYVSVDTLAAGGTAQAVMSGIAVDASDNVFVISTQGNYGHPGPGLLVESTAASGYASVKTLAAATGNFVDPTQIAVDGTGNVFVADSGNFAVKEVVLAPSPLAAAILPGARSVEAGTPATVFATMINAGSSDLASCFPSLPATAPSGLSFDYQTTDPTTNRATGVADQPVSIAAKGSQSFVLGFSAAGALSAAALPVVFDCTGVNAAPSTIGLDTVDLLFSATPVADIIALAATSSNDGTVHVGTGGGAFAIATIDAGAAATITATADTGTATLPLTILLCETNPTGQCLAPPAGSVTLSFAANATPTFSIFIAASGAVPFDPGDSRIFVRFKDAGGTSHGATSVAVTTG